MPEIDNLCPIIIRETAGLARTENPVRIGIPFPRSAVNDPAILQLLDPNGKAKQFQIKILEFWPDKSIKWALIDFLISVKANSEIILRLTITTPNTPKYADRQTTLKPRSYPAILVTKTDESLTIDTHKASFTLSKRGQCIDSVSISNTELINSKIPQLVMADTAGNLLVVKQSFPLITEEGSQRCTVVTEGVFNDNKGNLFANFSIQYSFWTGLSTVQVDFTIHNPRAAVHSGGLWDLGDNGSIHFNDLSLQLGLTGEQSKVEWQAESSGKISCEQHNSLTIHQNSSGGNNWDSPNHLNCNNEKTVSFSGYKTTSKTTGKETTVQEGQRATPWVKLSNTSSCLSGTILDFWQNFPKSIRVAGNTLHLALFPEEQNQPFELQGGEQKRHTIFLEFGINGKETQIQSLQHPLEVILSPKWLEKTKVIPYFSAPSPYDSPQYQEYINNIIEGENSFFNKREFIDEYGWRNFGDQYADHEAVNHQGSIPLISHYNNQYDFIFGAAVQYLKSGDNRWHELMEQQAKHVIDIDIYHTSKDKPSYNHGLFWHTDHYKEAGTCTHRTYSKKTLTTLPPKAVYGGGPSNEHNYSSGLMHYYYLTGDTEAQQAVIGLAKWVIQQDDGRKNIFGVIDESPTGLASQTVDVAYHKPGRGAGNSINTLIDAYRLTRDRKYMIKAEELLSRCIHPYDDIKSLNLDNPELRWSYLVFLQILGKYLDYKNELNEQDYHFHYARESLLHYAAWMKKHEVPYKDVLHKVDIPTETWPAHDVRKCHVFFLAAKYSKEHERHGYQEKANYFFQRGLTDLLSFETAFLTRPLIIMAVYGQVHSYFNKENRFLTFPPHNYDFGTPTNFIPQKNKLKKSLKNKTAIVANFIKTTISAKLANS